MLRSLMKKVHNMQKHRQCKYRDKNSKKEPIVKEMKNAFLASLDWTQPRRESVSLKISQQKLPKLKFKEKKNENKKKPNKTNNKEHLRTVG